LGEIKYFESIKVKFIKTNKKPAIDIVINQLKILSAKIDYYLLDNHQFLFKISMEDIKPKLQSKAKNQ